jgi:multicomponent Na+:H+ antiporter subunit D
VSFLVVAPIVLPLAAAGISQGLNRRPRAQRALSVGILAATLAVSVALAVVVHDRGIQVAHVGGWPAPIGITLAADLLSVIMLVVSTSMVLAVLIYAIGHPRTADQAPYFHPVYLVLTAGICAAFVTTDLFNLFVSFEVMLTASYVLITLGGRREQIRHGVTYVVINLLASMLFITAVGLVYAATGTVGMADLVDKIRAIDPALRSALGALFLVVFGVKAALFPLFFWLPDSYPTAPAPVTAIFAGLLTKVGVYAIIRTQLLLFGPGEGGSPLLLVVAGLTMTVGVLGAIAQDDVKRILSFHIISQIGYMIFGLGLFTLAGVAGAVFYIVHHIIVKTTLFLVGGMIEHTTGTGQLHRLGGLSHSAPALTVLFLVSALSLAGIPPFSGFVAKLSLVQAGLAADAAVIVAVSLAVSILTLFSMTKIWAGVFWGKPDEPPPIAESVGVSRLRMPRLMVWPTAALVVAGLAFTVAAGPLYSLGEQAAQGLIDPTGYVRVVSGR